MNRKRDILYQILIRMSCESSSQLDQIDKDPISSEKTDSHSPQHQPSQLETQIPIDSLLWIILNGTDPQFQAVLSRIGEDIQKKSNQALLNNHILHSRLLKLYYKAYQDLQYKGGQQQRLLYLLSLLAQILRQNLELKLPFSKKTVLSVLAFDHQSLDKVESPSQIIIIMAILYSNMAKQGRLMVRLGVQEQLKQSLLFLISKAEEFSVLRILLRAMLELQSKAKIAISPKQLQECSLFAKIRDLLGDKAVWKMRQILCRPKVNAIETVSKMTLFELISHK